MSDTELRMNAHLLKKVLVRAPELKQVTHPHALTHSHPHPQHTRTLTHWHTHTLTHSHTHTLTHSHTHTLTQGVDLPGGLMTRIEHTQEDRTQRA